MTGQRNQEFVSLHSYLYFDKEALITPYAFLPLFYSPIGAHFSLLSIFTLSLLVLLFTSLFICPFFILLPPNDTRLSPRHTICNPFFIKSWWVLVCNSNIVMKFRRFSKWALFKYKTTRYLIGLISKIQINQTFYPLLSPLEDKFLFNIK